MLFSSHILSEIDKVCDRVGIIKDGNLVALENIENLKQKKGKKIRFKIKENPKTFKGPKNYKIVNCYIEFITEDSIDSWI